MNIQFHNLKDKKPENGSTILYIKIGNYSCSWEPIFGKVEYVWDNLHGTQLDYKGEKSKKGFKLFLSIRPEYLGENDDFLWAETEEIEKNLFDFFENCDKMRNEHDN